MSLLTNRSELLFCYDCTDTNPNGDPLDNNKPRIDEETGQNFVTDVRLKRTIRDYLYTYQGFNGTNGKDIFVRDTSHKGILADGKTRAKAFQEKKETVLEQCIDVRIFGGVLPLKNASITFTGPVQFRLGRSLHKVALRFIKGTGAFASGAGKKQKTFREEYLLHYSFLAFHGIVNQAAAQHTQMTETDLQLLLEGMWHGTKNLISRSKFGQQPRLLIKVNYKTPHFFIGDLDKKIQLQSELLDEKLRSIKDFSVDLHPLLTTLKRYAKHIDSVEYQVHPDLNIEIPKDWEPLDLE